MKYLHWVVLFALSVGAARADYISGATGFTTLKSPTTGALVPGIINFAVLDQKNGAFADTWATGYNNFEYSFVPGTDAMATASPRLDTGAAYIYLYQTTNNGEAPYQASAVRIVDPSITSWGYFTDLGFADRAPGGSLTEISATHNLGTTDPGAAPGTASFTVYSPKVVNIGSSTDPGLNPMEVLLGGDAIRESWVGGTSLLTTGRRGTIIGFTSNDPPQILDGHVVIQCGQAGQPPCP